ncbi:HD domain-containing protein [Caldanaerobius polysaccharolyticus]|uniref:HD domain-containing protein n=1 Tax=Caldanaerobius polysaccharolyticus TaxID=44256 RepID=UPI00047B304A|nr:HD domain-containing protein [Caldanaerobius polysaccharolyticus]
MQDNVVQQVLKRAVLYFECDARRIHHLLKVYTFARNIAVLEGLAGNELVTVEISAILHDIGIKEAERKYNSSSARFQQEEGPGIAREILTPFGLEPGLVDRVCFIIGNHHTYTKIDGIDFQILVEADFLVNIFEEGIKDPDAIRSIKEKYFKTPTGIAYIESVFEGR